MLDVGIEGEVRMRLSRVSGSGGELSESEAEQKWTPLTSPLETVNKLTD